MTTTIDAGPREHPALLALHLRPVDITALGLRVHSDGVELDLGTLPADGRGVGALLARASQMLARLAASGRSGGAGAGKSPATVSAGVEKVRGWIVQKLRHLVRHLVGQLLKLAARSVGERARGGAKRPARGKVRPTQRKPSPAARKRAAKRGPQVKERQGPKGQPARRPLSPAQAKQVVRELPPAQVQRLAEGVTREQVRRVAAQLPDGQAEQAAPALEEVERAARRTASMGG